MTTDTTDILALPLILPAQAQKHVSHNEALALLDVLVQLVVLTRHRQTPPADPIAGDRHIVASGASGAWQDQAGKIAVFSQAEWMFIAPQPGWRAEVRHDGQAVLYSVTGWIPELDRLASQTLAVARLGVGGASPDASGPLALNGAASLFNHAGAGHQLKINKASAGDTASLIFQSGYSGRAEMGLAGNTSFSVKVSNNGSDWREGLVVAPATGVVNFPNGLTRAGASVYAQDNILGTVAKSGGQPTGAIIEQGETANGRYCRFADGTLICLHTGLSLPNVSQASGAGFASAQVSWTYPSAFLAASQPVVHAQVLNSDVWANASNASATQAQIRGMSFITQSGSVSLRLMAVGRWI